jgi:hypothetical protein
MGGPIPTQKGYQVSEVISALQKEIRRAKEREAVFWAYELCPQYEAYLWRRLLVIVHEDIGVANPLLLLMVPELRSQYFEFRSSPGKDGAARMVLTNLVVLMCRSPKSRLADELKTIVCDDRERGLRLEIPDYAVDKHTLRGKRKGRGMEHWLKEGCLLAPPPSESNGQYREEAEERWRKGNKYPEWGGKATISKAYRPPPDSVPPLFRQQQDPDDAETGND